MVEATLEHAFAMELTMNLTPKDHERFWMEEVPVALISCASRFKDPKWCCEQEFRLSVTDPSDILKFYSGGKSRIRVALARDMVSRVIRGTRSSPDMEIPSIPNLLSNHGYAADVQVVNAHV